MSWLAVALIALGAGCDLVVGLNDQPRLCSIQRFDRAAHADVAPLPSYDQATPLMPTSFSISGDASRAVVTFNGLPYEIALPGGAPVAIDLGPYVPAALALAPEGDELFVSAQLEPPLLSAARRDASGTWTLDGVAPAGVYAGTPSALEFGPARILVRLRDAQPDVQEYELDGNSWVAIGAPHAVGGMYAPNLTADGLAMTFAADGVAYAATRPSRDAWFGDAATIDANFERHPMLFDRCRTFYALDPDDVIRRYDL
jgi:hypothetical protein